MCRLAKGRHIMLLGDSMQEELFLTWFSGGLAYAVIPEDRASDEVLIKSLKARLYGTCDGSCPYNKRGPCEGPFEIPCGDGVPSYTISFTKVLHLAPLSSSGDEHPWMSRLVSLNVSLLLVNSGAHYLPTEPLLKNLNEFLQHVYRHLPDISIIYRNTPSGHPNCENHVHDIPLSPLSPLINNSVPVVIASQSNTNTNTYDNVTFHPEYKWEEILAQNTDVHSFLAQNYPQVLYLDVVTSTMLRHDSHPSGDDCLHYCLAGPVDSWLVLHYNALLRLMDYVEEVDILYSSVLNKMVYVPTPSVLTTVLPWVSPSINNTNDSDTSASKIDSNNTDPTADPIRYGILVESKDVYAFHGGQRHFCGPLSEVVPLLNPSENEQMDKWHLSTWDFINYPSGRPERSDTCNPDKSNKMTY